VGVAGGGWRALDSDDDVEADTTSKRSLLGGTRGSRFNEPAYKCRSPKYVRRLV
jgi:hypothetical protein